MQIVIYTYISDPYGTRENNAPEYTSEKSGHSLKVLLVPSCRPAL
jgi:hypothetical protein